MATVQAGIVDAALRLIGAIDPGETPATAERDDAFSALNQIVSSWNIAGLGLYYTKREIFSLTGAASYTIGSAQTFNTARPIKVLTAGVVSGGAQRPLKICTAEEWLALTTDRSRAGKFGKYLFLDNAFATGTLFILPVPASGGSLEMYSLKELAEFSSLGATIALPPGYERAFTFALALDIAPQFGVKPSQMVIDGAGEAKTAIMAANALLIGGPAQAQSQSEA